MQDNLSKEFYIMFPIIPCHVVCLALFNIQTKYCSTAKFISWQLLEMFLTSFTLLLHFSVCVLPWPSQLTIMIWKQSSHAVNSVTDRSLVLPSQVAHTTCYGIWAEWIGLLFACNATITVRNYFTFFLLSPNVLLCNGASQDLPSDHLYCLRNANFEEIIFGWKIVSYCMLIWHD